jgi:hypothetical protein
LDFRRIKAEGGIRGIIEKATQGIGFKHSTYRSSKEKVLEAGILWSAYHFGTGSDGVLQGSCFLDFVHPDPSDFEANPQGPSLTLLTHEIHSSATIHLAIPDLTEDASHLKDTVVTPAIEQSAVHLVGSVTSKIKCRLDSI